MRVGVTGKLVVKMNIPVAVRHATTQRAILTVIEVFIWIEGDLDT